MPRACLPPASLLLAVTLAAAGCSAQPRLTGAAAGGAARLAAAATSERWLVGLEGWPAPAARAAVMGRAGVRVVRELPEARLVVVEAAGGRAFNPALLSELPGVAFAGPDRLTPRERPEGTRAEVRPGAAVGGDDPYRRAQWYLSTLGLPRVWASGKVTRAVRVAVVDSGVDAAHVDLRGVVEPGYNAIAPGAGTGDANGHGTMCAGLIAAVGGNGYGIHGAAPNARIVPVKVGDTVSSLVDGLTWAASNAEVVTMSLSVKPTMPEYPVAQEALKRAAALVVGKGVPMVCSLGNTGDASRNVPAAFAGNEVPHLIAVAATTKQDRWATFSTYGAWCSLAAPGETVVTTGI
ncbi:MAG: S8 family serine peptidase, partial [Candidatus Sericytochromatia bacterium]|nr:S8 family serine peptidase [Candidatus Sericytochromatia bacterium]